MNKYNYTYNTIFLKQCQLPNWSTIPKNSTYYLIIMLIASKYLLFQNYAIFGSGLQATTTTIPNGSTTVMCSSTLLPIQLVKESLYIELKYWTKTGAYKVNGNNHTADVQEDQFPVHSAQDHNKPCGYYTKCSEYQNQIWLHISLKWSDIQHNRLLSSCYYKLWPHYKVLNYYMFCLWAYCQQVSFSPFTLSSCCLLASPSLCSSVGLCGNQK